MNTNDYTWPFKSRDVSEDQPDTTQLYNMIDEYFSDNLIVTQQDKHDSLVQILNEDYLSNQIVFDTRMNMYMTNSNLIELNCDIGLNDIMLSNQSHVEYISDDNIIGTLTTHNKAYINGVGSANGLFSITYNIHSINGDNVLVLQEVSYVLATVNHSHDYLLRDFLFYTNYSLDREIRAKEFNKSLRQHEVTNFTEQQAIKIKDIFVSNKRSDVFDCKASRKSTAKFYYNKVAI